ncbi:hypothetical protein EDD16DRAFT_29450 [Pisolithus croceorrhizus]|nr:hypothetical protein EDD16DRAFT_29450 [Pisolithus croceorrhizus]
MTSTSFTTSTSPQWDNRHRGFISPSELQQLRQASPGRPDHLHDLPARHPPTPTDNLTQSQPLLLSLQPQSQSTTSTTTHPQPQPRPAMPPASQSHARTSSFFSFRSRLSSQDHQLHDASSPQPPSTANGVTPTDFGPPPPPQMGQSKSVGPGRPSLDQHPDKLQQQQQSSVRRSSLTASQPSSQLHPEIRSVVQLTVAHARKVYFSGPLVKRVERLSEGQRPTKDDGWVDIWAQLGGTTLSIWDMREVEEANKQGREVPPTYLNVTDAFVHVLGAVTGPAVGDQPAKKYMNVLTLNTAGSNLVLFSCPSTQALISWASAFRLTAWEKSRLEEIYSAHLIRITLPFGKDTPSTLVRGRMEGWVRIRVAGQTDWKRMWMVVSAGSESSSELARASTNDSSRPVPVEAPRRKRMSNLFSRDHQEEPLPPRSLLSLFASPKSKDKKQPLLTLKEVSQAFAVYPERPELINRSTLMKLEGHLGEEEMAGSMRSRQGWLLVMPELEVGNTQPSEMLKWLVAIHDAFALYGRPKTYTWDPRDPISMMFGYPIGPGRDLLFLERELAETMNPREDRTSAIRSRLLGILSERMGSTDPSTRRDGPPALPPISSPAGLLSQQQPSSQVPGEALRLPQLPALNFDSVASPTPAPPVNRSPVQEPALGRALSPIAERQHSPSLSGDPKLAHSRSASDENQPLASLSASPTAVQDSGEREFGLSPSTNPLPMGMEAPKVSTDSLKRTSSSRPDSKLPSAGEITHMKSETTASSGGVEPMGIKLPFSPPTSPEVPSFSTASTVLSTPQGSAIGRQGSPYSGSGPGSGASPLLSDRAKSPVSSILTSPHSTLEKDLPSIQAVQAQAQETPQRLSSPSPRSLGRNVPVVPPVPDKTVSPSPMLQQQVPVPPAKPAPVQEASNENDFAAALFYMQQFDEKKAPPRRVPTTISENSESSPSSSEGAQPSSQPHSVTGRFPAAWRGPTSDGSIAGSRPPLGRKPSGARAQPTTSRPLNPDASSLSTPSPQSQHVHKSDFDVMPDNSKASASHGDDVNADALAALSFLDSIPSSAPLQTTAEPAPSPPPRQLESPQLSDGNPALESSENVTQYRSSFALSKQAAERKARMQAQQAAHQAAVNRPGRANGKRPVSGPRSAGWNESSDEEEEEEEEEDDDDADSDGEPSTADNKRPSQVHVPAPVSAPIPTTPIRPLRPHSRDASPAETTTATDANPYAQLRHPRNLPPVPRPQTQGPTGMADENLSGPPRRIVSEQRVRTPDDPTVIRSQSDYPPLPAQRQSMWTQVLEAGRQPGANPLPEPPPPPQRDTFVQIEPASVSMTKAFTPHGLLSAGMQDKQDRSAKRQEELARETGASLINVPNKPPPPQTGLLGAITAHERERKREGGVGAALTEREREKRLAEDRQRKLDEYQRQQLEMAQSGMFGGQPFGNFNPMMANPMMMGMNPMMTGSPMMPAPNPMMTGGFMGYPNMMPGYGAQHYMYAQQAAQAAYQQAMMAFSATGSHVPDGMHGGPAPMSPMLTGGGMGFDPRMSMMGMPMVSSPMGMSGMGLPMGPMGMQMTGGSAFDPRFSVAGMDESLRPPGPPGGQQGTGQNSPRNSSAGRGSPAGSRPLDAADRARDSPKS